MSSDILSKKEMFAFLNRVLAYLDTVRNTSDELVTEEYADVFDGCHVRLIELEMMSGVDTPEVTAIKLILAQDDRHTVHLDPPTRKQLEEAIR